MGNYEFMSTHTSRETSAEIPCGAPMLRQVFDELLWLKALGGRKDMSSGRVAKENQSSMKGRLKV